MFRIGYYVLQISGELRNAFSVGCPKNFIGRSRSHVSLSRNVVASAIVALRSAFTPSVPGFEDEHRHSVSNMHREPRVAWSQLIGSRRFSMGRAFVSTESRDTITNAVQALEDALQILIGNILRGQTKMIGDCWPQRSQHLLRRQRLARFFQIHLHTLSRIAQAAVTAAPGSLSIDL